MPLQDVERAFAENLILSGAVSGPKLLYPIMRCEESGESLPDLIQAMQLADPNLVRQARTVAQQVVQAARSQAFSFGEGAMVGPWELVQLRGEAYSGQSWLGRNPEGHTALVRLIPPGSGKDTDRRRRFVERSNPGLDPPHPSILKVDEADEDFGWLYTTTLGMDSQTLASLRLHGPMPEASALALAQSIAGSLAVVHDLGVVHGGLSPLAVVSHEQRIYLTDFGVSSAVLDGPVYGCVPGGRLGLLLYASPELIGGDSARGLDARDDLFSLGALLYHSLVGVTANDEFASPDSPWLVEPPVAPGFRDVLARLLAPVADNRYASTRVLLEDLNRVAIGGAPAAIAPDMGATSIRGRRSASALPQQILALETINPPPAPAPSSVADSPLDHSDVSSTVAALPDAPPQPPGRPGAESDEDEWEEGDEYEEEDEAEEEDEGRPRRKKKKKKKKTGKKASQRLAKAPKAPKAPRAKSASSRFAVSDVGARKKGGGWLLFTFTLILVVGGLVAAHFVTQPQGVDLGRTNLAEAFRMIHEKPVPYQRIQELLRQSLDVAGKDRQVASDAVLLLRELERIAGAERLALIPAGSQATAEDVKKAEQELIDLSVRADGLRIVHLLHYDTLRGDEIEDNLKWTQIADHLREAGYLSEAHDAYTRAGRKEDKAFVERLQTMCVYLPGGPYVMPGEDGEFGVVERSPCYLGRAEVTRGQYATFLRLFAGVEKKHVTCDRREPDKKNHLPEGWSDANPPAEESTLPVSGVDYYDAAAYAGFYGLQVADAETLRAATGGALGLSHPWGEGAPSLGVANVAGFYGGPAPSGCLPGGMAPCGALDLLGNLEEWTLIGRGTLTPVFGGHYETPVEELVAREGEPVACEERRATLGFRVMLPLGGEYRLSLATAEIAAARAGATRRAAPPLP